MAASHPTGNSRHEIGNLRNTWSHEQQLHESFGKLQDKSGQEPRRSRQAPLVPVVPVEPVIPIAHAPVVPLNVVSNEKFRKNPKKSEKIRKILSNISF